VNRLATERIAPLAEEQVFFERVFAWMGAALFVTGGVAYAIGRSSTALHALFEGNARGVIIFSFLVELGLVWSLSRLVQHMSAMEAAVLFLAYAGLNGVTISFIFEAFTTKSIFSTFLVTGAMFAAVAIWGYTTGADLTGWGSFLFMALIGQLVGLIVNIFWLNETLYWITTASGILIFTGLTAYDVQKLKQYEVPGDPDAEVVRKAAIVGALALYLDFVNLFLYLLRIFGRRR
jgi:FtsH-binding integral membrane protein